MLNYTVPKIVKFIKKQTKNPVKKPMLMGNVKCIFFILTNIFFLLHRTKEPVTLPPNHVVEHRIMRNDLDDKDGKKVLLEEYAKAHVNPV